VLHFVPTSYWSELYWSETMRRIIAVPLMLLFLTLAAGAQQAAIGFCALNKTLDFKVAKAGDKIALHLTRDLVVKGKTLMLRGTAFQRDRG